MKYKCDDENCGAVFTGEDIVFKEFPSNIEIITQTVMVRNIITEKNFMSSTRDIREGDCGLHCPKCGRAHLFGFDRYIEPSRVAV